jgi:hypothetical protein
MVFCLLVVCIGLVIRVGQASSGTWVEVIRFEDAVSQNTAYFTCDHAEWRINWSYSTDPQTGQYAGFAVTAYNNESQDVGAIMQMGNITTEGTSYIHNKQGTFYLAISVANVVGYVVVIEQDVESIPEFPAIWVILAMVMGCVGLIKRWKRELPNLYRSGGQI